MLAGRLPTGLLDLHLISIALECAFMSFSDRFLELPEYFLEFQEAFMELQDFFLELHPRSL